GDDFGVAERLAVLAPAFVGDEDAVAVRGEVDKVEPGELVVVAPAPGEIGGAVEAVVPRAGEVEVVGDEALHRRSVVGGEELVAPAGDRDVRVFRPGALAVGAVPEEILVAARLREG